MDSVFMSSNRCLFPSSEKHLGRIGVLPGETGVGSWLHGRKGRRNRFPRVVVSRKGQKVGDLLKDGGTRQRARKQELRRQALASYRARFFKALQDELSEEMLAVKERLQTWSKQRLQDEGLALFDLSVSSDGNLYRERVLRFFSTRGDGVLCPHHQFSQGDVVAISQYSPVEEDVIEGVVMERARRFLRVTVTVDQAKLLKAHPRWRLDLSANRVSFERCVSAVDLISSPSIRQVSLESTRVQIPEPSPGITVGLTSVDTIILGEGLLAIRNLILGHEGSMLNMDPETVGRAGQENGLYQAQRDAVSLEALAAATSPATTIGGKNLGSFKYSLKSTLHSMQTDLNASQEGALIAGMTQRVTLWQGPPGTGKTKTLVQFIRAFCRSGQGKVLACADSNVAVDNLLEGLLQQGLKVVRVGQPVKVERHPLMGRARELKQVAILQRQTARQINNGHKRMTSAKEATSTWEAAAALETQATRDILDRAEVVVSTCVGAGDTVLDGLKFQVCVIDEATQATEPVTLIPLLKSGSDRVVLVGDPAQLPPTVVSQDAVEAGLSISLFERLQLCGLKPSLLNTQYRMHPAIARLPSVMFYGGQLLSNPKPSERPAPKGFEWPNPEQPLVFIDCPDGKEESTPLGNSWFNRFEALQVVKAVELVLCGGDIDGAQLEVGVIAPYSAQVRLLQDLFLSAEGEEKGKYSGLEVKTVDGFQGREKEVIVLCTVRSNLGGKLGFVTDPRRMNVALTRAKRGVIVIGNAQTLVSNLFWASWLKQLKKQKLVVTSG